MIYRESLRFGWTEKKTVQALLEREQLLTTERSMERHNVLLGLGDRQYIAIAGLVGSEEGKN
jgi:hypothetical protein